MSVSMENPAIMIPAAQPPTKTFSVLVVDDSHDSLLLMREVIKNSDRKIFTAPSAKDAYKILNENKIDLILLDVQMPDVDGFEVATVIREQPHTRHIPIIFMTAIYKTKEDALKGYEVGGQDYLFKPLDADTVRAKVSALLHLTQIKTALDKERNAHMQFRELIEHSTDPVCILDSPLYRFEYTNHWFEQTLGYALEEIKGNLFFDFFKPKERETLIEMKPGETDEKTVIYKLKGEFRCPNDTLMKVEWTILEKYGKWLCIGKTIGLPVMQFQ